MRDLDKYPFICVPTEYGVMKVWYDDFQIGYPPTLDDPGMTPGVILVNFEYFDPEEEANSIPIKALYKDSVFVADLYKSLFSSLLLDYYEAEPDCE